MTLGESGFGRYEYGGSRKFLAFSPIEGTEGWSLAINAPTKDFTQSTVNGIIITIILMVVFLAISSYMAYRLARQIGEPVKGLRPAVKAVGGGGIWIHLFMRYIPGMRHRYWLIRPEPLSRGSGL